MTVFSIFKNQSAARWLTPLAILGLAACDSTDPTCPEGSTILIRVPKNQCFDVEVREENDQDQFLKTICADSEEFVTPGRYLYTVKRNGLTVSSGSKGVACNQTFTINLATGQMNMNTNPTPTPSPSVSPSVRPSPRPSASATPSPSPSVTPSTEPDPIPSWSGPTLIPDADSSDFTVETGADSLGNHHVLHALGTAQTFTYADPNIPNSTSSITVQTFTELRVLTFQNSPEDYAQRVIVQAPQGYEIQGPKMAVSKNGTVFVAWIQASPPVAGSVPNGNYPSLYGAIYTPAAGWTAPQLITSASGTVINFYHFGLGCDSNGNALVVWKEYEDSNIKFAARRFKRGSGWRAIERPTSISTSATGMLADGVAVGLLDSGKAMVLWNEGGAIFSATSSGAGNWTQGETVLSNLTVGVPITLLDAQFDELGNAAVAAFPSTNEVVGTVTYSVQANTYSPANGWSGKVDAIDLLGPNGTFDLAILPDAQVNPSNTFAKLAILPSGDILLAAGRSANFRSSDSTYEQKILLNRFSGVGNTWGATETIETFRRPVNLGGIPTSANNLAFDMDADEDGFVAIAYPYYSSSRLKTVVRTLDPGQTRWSAATVVSPMAYHSEFQPSITLQGIEDLLVSGSSQVGTEHQSWTNLFH